MRSLTIGLTGGIGVGKSTVAKLLSEKGAEIAVGDDLGREVLEKSPDIVQQISGKFGKTIFDASGQFNRRKLGELVFASQENAKWLTDLTFPYIYRLWNEKVRQSKEAVIVLDAALIFEWKIEQEFDILLVVTADDKSILERISSNARFNTEQLKARQSTQISQVIKNESADYIIENNGNENILEDQVEEFWNNFVLPKLEKARKAHD